MFGDVLDNIEWKYHIRADGFVMSVYSSIMLAMPSIITGVLTFVLGVFQYDAVTHSTGPALNAVYINCYYGVEVIGNIICFAILLLYDLEKVLPDHQEEMCAQRKAETSV